MPSSESKPRPEASEPWFLAGDGVTNALARSIDWSKNILGAWDGWPTSLKATLAMVFHARQPMFVWWGPELIQFYNDAYLPSFGRGKHPMAMGQRGQDCWQEIWPIIWPQIEDVMERGKASWNEDHLVPIERNGRIEEVYWTYSYGPVFDDDGRIGGTLVICTETTARVIAERRMRMLRALGDVTSLASDLPGLLRTAADVITSFGADIPCAALYLADGGSGGLRMIGRVGFSEPEARALECSLDALPAGSTEDRSPRVIPLAGPTGPAASTASTASSVADPWSEPVEQGWLASLGGPDAHPASVLLGVSPRLSFDDPYRHFFAQVLEHLVVARTRIDADQARLATQRERNNLLLQAPFGTALMTGPRHLFALANPLYCRMVGRSSLVGKTYLEAFPELTDTPLPGILDRVYATGEPFVAPESLVSLDLEGNGVLVERYFRFNLEPLRDDRQAVYGMMAVAIDITDQVVARQVLEKTGHEREKLLGALEAANRTKDEFLAMLGHELRNPLSPIVSALQLMKLRGTGAPSREQQIIERQVTHLVRLVDDLLDVSRITRGQVELRKEVVDISEIVMKAVEMSNSLFEKRGHGLALDIAKGPLLCDGDPVRLAQVIANLLTNAAKYTPAGGQIRLGARLDPENHEIVIAVADDGIGIAAEVLPRVFDLFMQGRRGLDRFEGGLGIGLALVKNLLGLHGGRVEALSEGPGKGSQFIVRLPAAALVTTTREAQAISAPGASKAGDRRVLVVDDNLDAAELLREMLSVLGYEVALAHEAQAALDMITAFSPHAAILDIGLPVMDGYQLAARIRGDPRRASCRLIALSGYGQDQDRRRSSEAGFEHHLVKPVDFDRLLALLEQDAS